jgi:hypothetical protein
MPLLWYIAAGTQSCREELRAHGEALASAVASLRDAAANQLAAGNMRDARE